MTSTTTITADASISGPISPKVAGFIGLGSMGGRMATNLAKGMPGGSTLLVYDVIPNASEKFIARNTELSGVQLKIANSPGELALQAEMVFTALPGPSESKSVYDEIGRALKTQQGNNHRKIFLECGTVGPACAKFCAGVIEQAGSVYVDSPMSGGIGGAERGTLTFMIGTPDCESPPQNVDETTRLLEQVRPWLNLMGSKVYICGKVGTGQTAKLLNNLQEYSSLLALSESLLLGVAHGIPPQLLTNILNSSSGSSWISQNYNPAPEVQPDAPASRGYALPGFPVFGAVKDLSLALELARDVGLVPIVGNVTYEANREVQEDERFRKLDYTVIYEWLKEKWGL